jgi:hypothetical protein
MFPYQSQREKIFWILESCIHGRRVRGTTDRVRGLYRFDRTSDWVSLGQHGLRNGMARWEDQASGAKPAVVIWGVFLIKVLIITSMACFTTDMSGHRFLWASVRLQGPTCGQLIQIHVA